MSRRRVGRSAASGPVAGSRVVLAALVVALATGAPVWGVGRAAAQGVEEVGDAQVVALGAASTPPAGVRELPPLAGLAFWAPSVSAGFVGEVSEPEGTYSPAVAGNQLLHLSVEAYSFSAPFGQTGYHFAAPGLSVRFTDHAVALPESPDGSVGGVAGSGHGDTGAYWPGAWVVAVPTGATVFLVATEDGFSQTLNLRTGQRVGRAPTVLYRSASGPLALDVRPNLVRSLVVHAAGSRVAFPVTLRETTLSFFDLASADAPAPLPAGEAYLFVEVSVGIGTDQAGRADWHFDPSVPEQTVTLDVPGRPAISPVVTPAPPGPTNTATFSGLFGLVVPASVTSARFTIAVAGSPSVYFDGPQDSAPQAESVSSGAPLSFGLGFPSPSRPATSSPPPGAASPSGVTGGSGSLAPAPPTGVSVPTAAASGRSVRQRAAGGAVGLLTVVPAAGGGVVMLVVGVVFVSRQRQLVEPRPVPEDDGDDAHPGSPAPAPGVVAADSGDGETVAAGEAVAAAVSVAAVSVAAAPWAEGEGSDPAGRRPALSVRLIGPLEVEGATGAIRRRTVLRSLIVLALNLGRPVSADELRYCLANSDDAEPSAASVRSELSRLRRVVAAGVLPERQVAAGYGLAAELVEVDWDRFARLASRAGEEPAGRVELGLGALGLVRGPVLVHQTWHGIDSKVWEMTAEIERVAAETAAAALESGQADLAALAARRGLLGVPASPRLWRLRLEAARAGSGENADEIAVQARRELGSDP
ncbi:MAG: AfsR/SARP family transcriptional regulator [Acidimicrobiales bacterium]